MELYLGLPSRVVRSKRELFSMIRDRIWKRITGWNDKFLSQAGKEVLIKSIVQAIPSYAISCFKLPITLLTEIQGMISNFWWHNRGQRKIHWLSWQRLCDSKLQGGLGFRRLHLFNLAMLAKNLWRIFTSPERPFVVCSVLDIFLTVIFLQRLSGTDLPILGAVLWLHIGFCAGCRWRVGSGEKIKVWTDPWLPRPVSFRPITPPNERFEFLRVSDLINQETGDWNSTVIQDIFLPLDCEVILGIPLGRTVCEDLLIWHYSTNGLFSVRSAYHLACSMEESPCSSNLKETEHSWWRRLADTSTRAVISLVAFRGPALPAPSARSCRGCFALSKGVSLRTPSLGPVQPSCGLYLPACKDVFAWFRAVLARLDKREFEYFLCICWALWWCRNSKLVQGNCLDPDHLICFVVRHLEAFHQQSFVPPPPHRLISPPQWQYPPPNFIKLNFDGAVFDQERKLGLVLWQGTIGGIVLVGCLCVWLRLQTAPWLKLFAAREAVLFAINRGWQNVVLEGDCATLITKLLSGLRDFSAIGSITLDIQNLISYFQFSRFSFVQRSCNSVAHALAKLALGSASGESNIPAPAAHFVMLDNLATT
ncbi:UNVERIFIED_CONTAM: hypothetical protein Sangu_0502900 [Sesamum angustifolium]|uniref:RNase H type-1 domain-containing protein n=1 Tax=Sesamum angustifolium TaxID=2727405 RepID=A0AAW2Q8H0_9LAMI